MLDFFTMCTLKGIIFECSYRDAHDRFGSYHKLLRPTVVALATCTQHTLTIENQR